MLRLVTTVALSCLIAASTPEAATASGRGDAQAAGNHGPRGEPAAAAGATQGRARQGGAPPNASPPPASPRPGVSRARIKPRRRAVATGLAALPDQNPDESTLPEPPVARAAPRTPPPSSSIQPLQPSPLPQSSQSSSRGTLRLETGPPNAQLYVDGFYVGTIEEANRSQPGLSLPVGWHRLEIRAPGYVTPAINLTIEANRTFIYHGGLTPLWQ